MQRMRAPQSGLTLRKLSHRWMAPKSEGGGCDDGAETDDRSADRASNTALPNFELQPTKARPVNSVGVSVRGPAAAW